MPKRTNSFKLDTGKKLKISGVQKRGIHAPLHLDIDWVSPEKGKYFNFCWDS